MKKTVSLMLVISILFSFTVSYAAADITKLEGPELWGFMTMSLIVEELKNCLLDPSSLDIREAGVIEISSKDAICFAALHYVAKNRMGGYSDNWVYALVRNVIPDVGVALLSTDGKLMTGDAQLLEALNENLLQYMKYMDDEQWVDVPVEYLN